MICCAYLLTLSHFLLPPFYAVDQGRHHHRVYDDVPVDWSWYLSKYHKRKSAVILNIIVGMIQRGIAFIRQFYKLSLGLGVIHFCKKKKRTLWFVWLQTTANMPELWLIGQEKHENRINPFTCFTIFVHKLPPSNRTGSWHNDASLAPTLFTLVQLMEKMPDLHFLLSTCPQTNLQKAVCDSTSTQVCLVYDVIG